MTTEEQTNNPSHKVTGGFLRKTNRHDWTKLTPKDKAFIKALPGYDDTIFKQISNGVSLIEEEMIEVIIGGIVKMISKKKAKELGFIDV
jgi:hypothetical protein